MIHDLLKVLLMIGMTVLVITLVISIIILIFHNRWCSREEELFCSTEIIQDLNVLSDYIVLTSGKILIVTRQHPP